MAPNRRLPQDPPHAASEEESEEESSGSEEEESEEGNTVSKDKGEEPEKENAKDQGEENSVSEEEESEEENTDTVSKDKGEEPEKENAKDQDEEDSVSEKEESEEDKTSSSGDGSDSESESKNPKASKIPPVAIGKASPSPSEKRKSHAETVILQSRVSEVQKKRKQNSSVIPRIWSKDDDIVILKGMKEYGPIANMKAFHEFIKGKVQHVDSSVPQLYGKIRRLKAWYVKAAKKSENPDFAEPYDRRVFKLSRKIWGTGTNTKKQKQPQTSASLPYKEDVELASSNSSLFDFLLNHERLFQPPNSVTNLTKDAFPLLGNSEIKRLESVWRKMQESEYELYLKRVDFFWECTQKMYEAKKSSKC